MKRFLAAAVAIMMSLSFVNVSAQTTEEPVVQPKVTTTVNTSTLFEVDGEIKVEGATLLKSDVRINGVEYPLATTDQTGGVYTFTLNYKAFLTEKGLEDLAGEFAALELKYNTLVQEIADLEDPETEGGEEVTEDTLAEEVETPAEVLAKKKKELENVTQELEDFKLINFSYLFTFTNADAEVAYIRVNEFEDLVDGKTIVFPEEPEEVEDLIVLVVNFQDGTFIVGEEIDFNTLSIVLWNVTKGTREILTLDDVVITNEKGENVTSTIIPEIFHDNMNGELFTITYTDEDTNEVYEDVISTGVYVSKNQSVSFDSLNVEINYGAYSNFKNTIDDQYVALSHKVLEEITSYTKPTIESHPDIVNGKEFWSGTQELTFKAPGEYKIPLIHYVGDAEAEVLGNVYVEVTADTNKELVIGYNDTDGIFNVNNLTATTETGEVITYENESLFVYDQDLKVVDENYTIAPGTSEVLFVTYVPTNQRALNNPTVHYGAIEIVVLDNGAVKPVVPVTPVTPPTTPPTGISNNLAFFVGMFVLAGAGLIILNRSKKVN